MLWFDSVSRKNLLEICRSEIFVHTKCPPGAYTVCAGKYRPGDGPLGLSKRAICLFKVQEESCLSVSDNASKKYDCLKRSL